MIYDSGVIEIYTLAKTADGNMPSTTGVLLTKQYFGDRTVGSRRYFDAKANDDRIDRLVECWARSEVNTNCYALIGSVRYRIVQVQYAQNDDNLPIMLLSLERQDDEVEDETTETEEEENSSDES